MLSCTDAICTVAFCRMGRGVPDVKCGSQCGVGKNVHVDSVFFFSSDLWICECLVTSSSQHCFCVEIPDCAVHACYNRRSEAGRMAKASVSLFFFFCCFGAKDRATLDDSPPSCDEFTMKLSIMGLISTESVAPVSFQVETTGLEAFTSHFVTCLKHCAVLSAPLSAPV